MRNKFSKGDKVVINSTLWRYYWEVTFGSFRYYDDYICVSTTDWLHIEWDAYNKFWLWEVNNMNIFQKIKYYALKAWYMNRKWFNEWDILRFRWQDISWDYWTCILLHEDKRLAFCYIYTKEKNIVMVRSIELRNMNILERMRYRLFWISKSKWVESSYIYNNPWDSLDRTNKFPKVNRKPSPDRHISRDDVYWYKHPFPHLLNWVKTGGKLVEDVDRYELREKLFWPFN